MAISKIILNGVTQIDLTSDTVAASNLISPNTAHGADGNPITGTATGGISGTYMFPIEQNNDGIWVPVTTDFSEIAEAQSNGLAPIGYDVASGTFVWVSYYENYEGFSEALSYGYKEPYTDQSDYRNTGTADIWVTHGYYSGALKTEHTLYVTYNTQNATATADKTLSGYTAFGPNGIIDGTASQGITPTGTKNISITQNGTTTEDVTNYASAQITVNVPTGSTKNVQYYMGAAYARAASYTATDVTLTVSKTGTYKVSWMGWRSTSSGTSGSQLYINGNAHGSANETFTSTYGQAITLSSVSLTQGDVLVVRARARGTNYYMYVGNLIIEEQ